jgi:hypothetical protein
LCVFMWNRLARRMAGPRYHPSIHTNQPKL